MAQDPYKYFRPEARDLVDQFARGVLELEKGSGVAAVQRLLRLAHTLKGAARVVRQSDIADRAHAIEDTLAPFRNSVDGVAREHIDTVLEHIDAISSRLVTLVPAADADISAKADAFVDERRRTIRADVAEADAMLDGVVETYAHVRALRSVTRELERARQLADLLSVKSTPFPLSEQDGRAARRASGRRTIAQELRRTIMGVERNLGSAVDQMGHELRQLRETSERMRLVSVESLFTTLERTTRDTARALSKQAVFEGTGGEIRLDAPILDTVQSALVQIVRNAVAHGIELAREREQAGKPAAGRVCVAISRRGHHVAFKCSDDGRGVNLDAVRRAAAHRGMVDPAAQELGSDDLTRLLLRGGISTSPTITAVSGRGIGLDVVRDAVERLGGEITVRTVAGNGTTFELIVPSSLAYMQALMIETAGACGVVAIPLDAVRGTLRVAAADVSRTADGVSLRYDRQAIPFVSLSTALDGTHGSAGPGSAVMIVADGDDIAAVGVARFLGIANIVVRPLPQHMIASPIVVGAALDGDGNPQLVLDPAGLVAAARRAQGGEVDQPTAKRPILVVDDSLTTRMLEQSILESAGYDVDLALSGEHALDVVRSRPYALILVDVEMPGIDGFTFIERIRADPALHHIPAILVSSRNEPEDHRRGSDVGAQAYIVKSEFDQAELLRTIRSLMEPA